MKNTLIAKTTHSMMKAKARANFIEAGGNDGRFREKTIKSAKDFKRQPKHKAKGWE